MEIKLNVNENQMGYLIDHYCLMFYDEDWDDQSHLVDSELEDLRQQLEEQQKLVA